MPTLTKTLLWLAIFSFVGLPAHDALASQGISKNRAVSAATAKYPGKVVKISSNKNYYHVRVLQKTGQVITVKVDKKTGKVLQSRKRGR